MSLFNLIKKELTFFGIDPLRFVMLKGVNLYGSEHMKPLGVEHRRVGIVKVVGPLNFADK